MCSFNLHVCICACLLNLICMYEYGPWCLAVMCVPLPLHGWRILPPRSSSAWPCLLRGQREDDLTAADTPTQTGPGNARPLEYVCMFAFIAGMYV
jgi:hypothetical protein